MAEWRAFELEDGTIVQVEIKEEEHDGTRRVSRGGGRGEDEDEEKPPGRFSDAIKHIRPTAEAVLTALRGMNTPNEIGLEFGVKFSAKAGAFLVSADGESHFKVALKWTNPKVAS